MSRKVSYYFNLAGHSMVSQSISPGKFKVFLDRLLEGVVKYDRVSYWWTVIILCWCVFTYH